MKLSLVEIDRPTLDQAVRYIRTYTGKGDLPDVYINGLYSNANTDVIPYLTHLFYAMDIDPLLYVENLYTDMFSEFDMITISIPGHIKSLGVCSLSYCPYVTEVTLEEGVESIKGFAFQGCPKLHRIKLPKSLKMIFSGAFWDCPNLKTIYYAGTKSDWESINGHNPFDHKSKLVIKCIDGKIDIV